MFDSDSVMLEIITRASKNAVGSFSTNITFQDYFTNGTLKTDSIVWNVVTPTTVLPTFTPNVYLFYK